MQCPCGCFYKQTNYSDHRLDLCPACIQSSNDQGYMSKEWEHQYVQDDSGEPERS
ncbi:hypothetical protein KUA24_102 [Vibrio phage HNL01]|nr:hypothetical protein KUA24_102 [Vibrio phage HNL01]